MNDSRAPSVMDQHEGHDPLSDGYLSDSAMEQSKDKKKQKKWKVMVGAWHGAWSLVRGWLAVVPIFVDDLLFSCSFIVGDGSVENSSRSGGLTYLVLGRGVLNTLAGPGGLRI